MLNLTPSSKLRLVDNPYHRERPAKHPFPKITPEARKYAVKELARRAGVSADFFRQWAIDITPESTIASFGPEVHGYVSFPNHSEESMEYAAPGSLPVARSRWMCEPHGAMPVPDLIIPFAEKASDARGPLYFAKSLGGLTCRHDLLRSILFTLSRVEESSCDTLDEHGRFPASASIAVKQDFVERPIIDEHGYAFQQALSALIPGWRPTQRPLYLKLTHDIDDVGIPFQLRTSLAHAVKRGRPLATARDSLARVTNVNPAELHAVRMLQEISKLKGLRSAYFWKASSITQHDSGYDPNHPKIQRVIRYLREQGCELGAHPGYKTFRDRTNLAAEIERLKDCLGVTALGGRQHYLRWTPLTWQDWEACGLHYDSSVGFADRFGFRAGTSVPYRPWCFAENRELDLIEVPLILMDCTPVKYMSLSLQQARTRILAMVRRMEHTGGVFSLLWHNTPILDHAYDGWYEMILSTLAGAKHYDVPLKTQHLW
jgi:hypothetical protein